MTAEGNRMVAEAIAAAIPLEMLKSLAEPQ